MPQPPTVRATTSELQKPDQPQLSTARSITSKVQKSDPPQSYTTPTTVTTAAEINVCDKHYHLSQQLLPLLDPVTVKIEDKSTTNIESTQQIEHEKDEHEKTIPSSISEETAATTSTSPENELPDDIPQQTLNNEEKTETDEQNNDNKQQLLSNKNQERASDQSNYREIEHEMDEQEMHAADGLLLLQELSQFDNPDTEEDENSHLMPIGKDPVLTKPTSQISNATEITTKEITKDDTSEDTIIYDPPDSDLTPNTNDEPAQSLPLSEKDEHSEAAPQTATELTVNQKLEKDERTETYEKDKKRDISDT